LKDGRELGKKLFEAGLHLPCDHGKVVEQVMKAPDILLAR
jgi:hypothetical protein